MVLAQAIPMFLHPWQLWLPWAPRPVTAPTHGLFMPLASFRSPDFLVYKMG